MEARKEIFTIGHRPLVPVGVFVDSLMHYRVRCVVDVRRQTDLEAMGEYCDAKLGETLRAHGMVYMPFKEEFGIVDVEAMKRGEPVYEKVVKTERFLHGVERLANGVEKGYVIALLGYDANPSMCVRYTTIGRYLTDEGWDVWHIVHEGDGVKDRYRHVRLLSQVELTENIERWKDMMLQKRRQALLLGRDGEEMAAQYLIEHGFTILDKNWNLHRGCELDIVAFKDNVVHAVEVKTRTSDRIGDPEQAIDERKMKNLAKALGEYLYRNGLKNVGAQIDSVAIVMKGDDDYVLRMHENLIRRAVYKYWK